MYDEAQLILFLLIMMRITGFVSFNPIFGRRGIPNLVKAGFIFVLTLCVYFYTPTQAPTVPRTALEFCIKMLLEFGVGYAVSFIIQCFFYVVLQAGSQIDNQMGLSMSENYDPSMGTNITMTSTFFNIMFMLLFFSANGHITLLRIFVSSGQIVPFGSVAITEQVTTYVLDTFVSCVVLSLKLALPILAASLIGQLGMGILMKVIPQINVFAINMELKIILGLFMIMLLITPIGEFILLIEKQMLVAIQDVIKAIAA